MPEGGGCLTLPSI